MFRRTRLCRFPPTLRTRLIDALNQHSAIHMVGELFNDSTEAMAFPELSVELFGYRPAGRSLTVEDRGVITNRLYVAESLKRADGFKLLYHHLDSVPNDVAGYLKERSDVKLIHLVRRDLLARYVSQLCAGRDDKWQIPKDGDALDQSPIEVEAERFRKNASVCAAREQFYGQLFGGKARTFAYEDLVSQEVARYTYKWLRDEACGALDCFVVERYPVYENSGYSRQIV